MGSGGERGTWVAGSAVTLLCFVSGATDVLSYMTLGRIFTSAMTGCTAVLFVALISLKYQKAIRAGLSLLSYAVGGAVATLLQPRQDRRADEPVVLRRLLVAEAVLLTIYCIVAALAPQTMPPDVRDGLVFLSALAMGIQAVTARHIHEKGITTVVLNITITSLIVALTKGATGRGERPVTRHNGLQAIVLAGYAVGAGVSAGALFEHWFAGDLLPLAGVLITLALPFQQNHRKPN